ncbi:MAG TPA: ABC transporter ATP-binding protein [Symbiobacteriaceae bacterium]|nr:ABC transporter ATP-binding protein [Symbiobacteriaceae bacterium]
MVILEAKNLVKRFGGLIATNDVSLSVEQGSITGVIGPNGAGKTTLFALISGFHTLSSGEIWFEGKRIDGLKPYDLCKRGVARTFQVVKPFASKSVLYNVTVGAFARTNRTAEAERSALEVLKLTGLYEKRDALAKSLTIVDRKRLEVAKALATGPKLLLLDEVLAGLTPREVGEAVELVRTIREQGVTILMIEHVMQAVMALCENVHVIHHGVKIAEGTPMEVTRNETVIKAYLGEKYAAAAGSQ